MTSRAIPWLTSLSGLATELRHSIRSLTRAPGFALGAIAVLAVGVGLNVSVFGVVDALFFRLPGGIADAGELDRLYIVRDEGMIQTPRGGGGSFVDYQALQAGIANVAATAAFLDPSAFDLGLGNEARRVEGQIVSGSYFTLLGVGMAIGRPFQPDEDSAAGSAPVVVISYRLWQQTFGGDPAIIGQPLTLNGRKLIVVGVTNEQFHGLGVEAVDVWAPMAMAASLGEMDSDGGDWRERPFTTEVEVVARLASGVNAQAVARQADAVLAHAAPSGLDPTPSVILTSLEAASGPDRSDAAKLALYLLAMTGMILVMVWANLANLFIARAMARQGEMAVRLALGATVARVVRLVLLENVLLAFAGAALSLLLVFWGSVVARRFPLPPGAGTFSWRVVGFATLVALASGVVPALFSGLSAARIEPARWLTGSLRFATTGGGRARSALLSVQAALSVILLIGAALFVRSTSRLADVNPGVDVNNLLVSSISLLRAGYTPAARDALYASAIERLQQVPGVERVTIAHFAPLDGLRYSTDIQIAGRADGPIEDNFVNWIGAGYFETVGSKVLRGRGIGDQDRFGTEPVVVVNASLARRLASVGDALGMCIAIKSQMADGSCARIVGVVSDQRGTYLDPAIEPTVYLAWDQYPDASSSIDGYLLVRSRVAVGAPVDEVRNVLRDLGANLPFVTVEALSDRLQPEITHLRLGSLLFSLLGVVSLVVAGMGVYGVVNYFVSERRSEIGIRKALGSTSMQIVWFVLRRAMLPIGVGISLGVAVAFAGSSVLESLLYGVSGRDLLSYATAVVFLGLVSLLACLGPGMRASSVPPMTVLRHE